MNSKEIRDKFIRFFESRQHVYAIPSPIVNTDDPTLMFTNAGMNQFKNIFLGTQDITTPRLVNSQICLRVSGKHNDIDEVGLDVYHHTLFEMLGNWSMNDYFKHDAIKSAWELLTTVYDLSPDRLYVTVFEGDDVVQRDDEAIAIWSELIPDKSHIILGNKHYNFWEMGETGPCGPCSEIHIDLRDDEERIKTPGCCYVNKNHPDVIEIWNIVFMQYQRCSDGSLKHLEKHFIDTGMGFERLVRILQGKTSNYDTDIFTPYIKYLEDLSGKRYCSDEDIAISMRVIADHIRAITMTIGEGLIPSNIKEGYVIRRLLRRAVRYGYSFLHFDKPFLHNLVPLVIDNMSFFKCNIKFSQDKIVAIVLREEESFIKTLKLGIKRLQSIIDKNKICGNIIINGDDIFELYDTYGFPSDLTAIILKENGMTFDQEAFAKALQEQKNRSRQANSITAEDWIVLNNNPTEFIGYDSYECVSTINKYRVVTDNENRYYQIIFNKTPFYGERGGQVGDTGTINTNNETIDVFDTKKEFGETLHCVTILPKNINAFFTLRIDVKRRDKISANHSCTHILHAVLRSLYGSDLKQCGSKVDANKLRFDFNYAKSLSQDDINNIECVVNSKLREGLTLLDQRDVKINDAKKENAIALFKYEEKVRVVSFGDFSKEFCCGTHISNTIQIKNFKILKCKSVSRGIKRIEATTEIL